MLILGLDPGSAITGYGLIAADRGNYHMLEYGALRTAPGPSDAERLVLLYEKLLRLLRELKPDCIAIEQLFFNKNTTTAGPVGQARGVLLLGCAQMGLDIAEYTPLQVKQALTGYGRADKGQIQYMVRRLLNLNELPKPDDAADALAIAITHAHHFRGVLLREEAQKIQIKGGQI